MAIAKMKRLELVALQSDRETLMEALLRLGCVEIREPEEQPELLHRQGYTVDVSNDGVSGLDNALSGIYDLVVLDVMLPGMDGFELLRRLRAAPATRSIPVVMATARGAEYDKIQALDLGADYYLTKPFGVMELVSCVKAVLRRCQMQAPAHLLQSGGILVDLDAHTVTANGQRVELTFKEYALLHLFLEHPEEVLARERIMKDVWDTDDLLESRTIDMHVRTLRQKLGAAGEAIRTVRKVGYKLSTEGSDD